MAQVTIKDIARIAGVSNATVSRALSGAAGISEATRQRILKICEEEGYRVNSLARSLVSNKSNVIGLIIPDIMNPFYAELTYGVESSARELGYNVMLCNSKQDVGQEQELFEFLLGHQVDGIIVASSQNEASFWVSKYFRNVPIVLLGESSEADLMGSGINSVCVDNRLGGEIAASHLYSLGHRDILYLGSRPGSNTHSIRLKGFLDFLSTKGLSAEVLENKSSTSNIESGYELGMRALSSPFIFTAIFAATDSLALGVMRAADDLGIKIPEDVSLLGFDNIAYSGLPKIELTTIDQKKPVMAHATVELLVKIINDPDSGEYTKRLIKPELLVRKSCKSI